MHRQVVPLLLALAVAAGACSTSASDTGADAFPTNMPTMASGELEGRVVERADHQLTVDLVEVLSGQEAVEAAIDDGLEVEGDTLPNDVYVRDADATTTTWTVADGATVELVDCTEACEQVEVDLDDWFGGTATAFGGDQAVYRLVVVDGEVTEVAEIYLP